MKTLVIFIATLLTTLGLAGCASNAETDEEPGTNAGSGNAPPIHAGDATIDMVDMTFSPEVLRIHVGATVTWRNLEDMGHTVSPNDEAQWGTAGSGNAPDQWMMKDATWSHTFSAPGTYDYRCLPHATRSGNGYMGMIGTIIVE